MYFFSLLILAGFLNIGGAFGELAQNIASQYFRVGIIGGFLIALLLGLFGYRMLFNKEITLLSIAGSVLALVSVSAFVAASATYYDAEIWGGPLGVLLADRMQEWFSALSFLLLPVIFICSLFLMHIISISTLADIWDRFLEWRERKREEREERMEMEEDAYDEEEYDEEGEEEEYEEGEEYDEEYEDEEYDEEEYEEEEEEKPKKKTSLFGRKKTQKDKEEKSFSSEPPLFTHDYTPPPLSILSNKKEAQSVGNTKNLVQSIQRTFKTFNINVQVEEVDIGPTVSRFALKVEEGVRLTRITGLQSNLELALAAHPIRIEAPIPGRSLVGIEIPNTARRTVRIRSLISSDVFQQSSAKLPVAVGEEVTGALFDLDIAKLPHLLVAGTTGSGKSVFIHSILISLIYARGPQDLRFILIDPKKVELTLYDGIPHLYTSVITDASKAVKALIWAVNEMERRYSLLEEHRVRDLDSYNKARAAWLEKQKKKNEKAQKENTDEEQEEKEEEKMPALPYLVIVVDELSDLMQVQPRELEASIVRLAQKSRAVGMHLILSTQRPSVNVITGLIKANIPSRVALRVPSQIDARTVMDTQGAETLLGNGDMLIRLSDGKKASRIQGAFIDEDEVKKVVDSLIKTYGRTSPDLSITSSSENEGKKKEGNSLAGFLENGGVEGEAEDELFLEAKEIVIQAKKASTSLLQRRLRVGYSRAARLMDMLEERGVIGAQDGSKPREVLIQEEE